MNWKIISYISFFLIFIIVAKWVYDSVDYGSILIFSKDKKAIETKFYDSILGTNVEKTDWKEGYWIGLFPNEVKISIKTILSVLPLSAIFFIIGFLLLFVNNKCKHKATINDSEDK